MVTCPFHNQRKASSIRLCEKNDYLFTFRAEHAHEILYLYLKGWCKQL